MGKLRGFLALHAPARCRAAARLDRGKCSAIAVVCTSAVQLKWPSVDAGTTCPQARSGSLAMLHSPTPPPCMVSVMGAAITLLNLSSPEALSRLKHAALPTGCCLHRESHPR